MLLEPLRAESSSGVLDALGNRICDLNAKIAYAESEALFGYIGSFGTGLVSCAAIMKFAATFAVGDGIMMLFIVVIAWRALSWKFRRIKLRRQLDRECRDLKRLMKTIESCSLGLRDALNLWNSEAVKLNDDAAVFDEKVTAEERRIHFDRARLLLLARHDLETRLARFNSLAPKVAELAVSGKSLE